ncbi:head-tail adaptor protein [Rhodobacteraceae bacterium]|nr:head-tail adaptor protein [Paracoccaceae bacterium]
MRAAKLRDRIVVERPLSGDDGYGNTVLEWKPHLKLWADVLEHLGRERIEAGRLAAPRTATIRVRSSSQTRGLTEADRIIARGLIWNITAIANVGRTGAQIEMTCEETTSSTPVE